jgi:uncharacterized protein (DUF433 family)
VHPARAFPNHIDDRRSRPVVAGTDIKVSQIAWEHEHHGMAPDEIVEAHPHLTLADVHAALAYFYDHMEAIQADWHGTPPSGLPAPEQAPAQVDAPKDLDAPPASMVTPIDDVDG